MVSAEAAGGVDVAKRIGAGEHFDVVVLAANAIDKLMADGAVGPWQSRGPGAIGCRHRGARWRDATCDRNGARTSKLRCSPHPR